MKPFSRRVRAAVKNLEKGLREGNQREIEASIQRADQNLKSLNPLIYTPALKVLQQATEGLTGLCQIQWRWRRRLWNRP